MTTTLEVPAIMVGLGPFGDRVVRRMLDEQAELLGDVVLPVRSNTGPQEPLRLRGITKARNFDPTEIAETVLAEARDILAHRRMITTRDAPGADGLTRLHILVVANLEDTETRKRLGPVLRSIERRLLGELSPIFEDYRTFSERNLVVLPLLATPHPGSGDQGRSIAETVKKLCRQLKETPPRSRATPQLFLIEDVAEFSILSEDELAQCVRNFATLILYSLSSVTHPTALLYGTQPDEPLATFVCAAAELPRARLRAYGVDRVALELVEAVLHEEGDTIGQEEIDALEDVELRTLEPERSADRDVLELINRYGPSVERDLEPGWLDSAEELRTRYGPDQGDPSIGKPQPAVRPPVGWSLERMREIEASWRLLQRRRFDDTIAREREKVQAARDELVDRFRDRVDRTLWSDPSPGVFRQSTELVAHLERAVSLRLEDAVRDRDRALPTPPPEFDHFQDQHAAFLDQARAKPDPKRLFLFGFIAILAAVLFCPILLRALADAAFIAETDWQSLWLRDLGWLTSMVLALLGVGAFLGLRFRAAHEAIRDSFHTMYDALEDTIVGRTGSVLEYFASRLRLAREVSRVEALLAVRGSVTRDHERLTLLDRAVTRARGDLLTALREVGAHRDENGREDISELLGNRGEALVESLVPNNAIEFIDKLLPKEARDARVRDVLHSMARDQRYRTRWREEVPFTSLEALRKAAEPHGQPVAEWDPFEDPESAEASANKIAEFARRQARSLRVALNISGHEALDPTGTTQALRGEALVPEPVFNEVKELLSTQGPAGRASIPVRPGVDRDRAFYVMTVGDIHENAVLSLRTKEEPSSRTDAPSWDGRFDVERGGTKDPVDDP